MGCRGHAARATSAVSRGKRLRTAPVERKKVSTTTAAATTTRDEDRRWLPLWIVGTQSNDLPSPGLQSDGKVGEAREHGPLGKLVLITSPALVAVPQADPVAAGRLQEWAVDSGALDYVTSTGLKLMTSSLRARVLR